MKGKILKALAVLLLITCITASNFIFVGINIAYALDELANQNIQLNKYVDFNVYLNENKEREITNKTETEGRLYINLNVKSGSLNDVKIQMQDANFNIGNIDNVFVKSVDNDNKTIDLNNIQYGNDVVIEIPISFEKQDTIDENYFNRETTFNLSGNYANNNNEIMPIYGSIKAKVIWEEEADTTLSTEIEKYVKIEDSKYLLQQKVEVSVNDNKLPKCEEKITIQNGTVLDKYPSTIVVLKNGKKLPEDKITIDSENKALIITTKNEAKDGKVTWGSGKDVYKIIYILEVQNQVNNVTLNTTSETKLYGKSDIISKQDEKNGQEQEISLTGEVVSNLIQSTKETYKGYIYYGKKNETTYSQKYNIEISNTENIETMTLESNGDGFILDDGKEISTNNSTYFKTLTVNKDNMKEILGEEGTITVTAGDTQIVINKDTEANENGDIVINKTDDEGNAIDLNANKIVITTTKPVTEGTLKILASKAISGDTGHNKDTLKRVNKIESKIKLQEKESKTETALLDTVNPVAKVKMESNVVSALNPEANDVKIYAILGATSNKYDLYKNPEIKVIIPKEIESFDFTHEELYANGLTLTNEPSLEKNEDGTSTITFKFNGEQASFGNKAAEGLVIGISGRMIVNKLTPTTNTSVKMTYTNENKNDEVYETKTDLKINSKEGILAYTQVSGFNNEETVETISDEVATSQLSMNSEAKTATVKMAVINNYEETVTDAVIVGKLETTFDSSLASAVEVKNLEGAKVVYSTNVDENKDSENWTESIEGAKAYKVLLPNNELENCKVVEFGYTFNVPEGLSYNESVNPKFELDYTYSGGSNKAVSAVSFATEEKEVKNQTEENNGKNQEESQDTPEESKDGEGDNNIDTQNIMAESQERQATDEETQVIELAQGVTASITAVTDDNRYLKDGDSVKEGSTIKYTVTVENNSGEDIENLTLKPEHTNAKYYGIVKVKMGSNEFAEDGSGKVPIDTNWYMIKQENEADELKLENLKDGDSSKVEYEIQVKDVNKENSKVEGKIIYSINSEETKQSNIRSYNINNGKVALTLLKNNYIEYPYQVNYEEVVELDVKNFTENVLSNQIVKIPLNGNVEIISVVNDEGEDITYDVENDNLMIKINNLDNNGDKYFITFIIKPFDVGHLNLMLQAEINLNEDIYYSNKFVEGVNFNQTNLTVSQYYDKKNEKLEKEDEFKVNLKIKNNANFADTIIISSTIPDVISIQNITENGKDIESNSNNIIYYTSKIEPESTIEYIYTFKVNKYLYDYEDFSFNFIVHGDNNFYSTEQIYYELNNKIDENDDEDEYPSYDPNGNQEENPEEKPGENPEENPGENPGENPEENPGENPGENPEENPEENPGEESNKNTISGKSWIDSNKDGIIASSENTMNNVKVYLLDSNSGNVVADTVTSNDGQYSFENIENGQYIVAFEYDTSEYRVTNYKQSGVDEDNNSDVISTTLTINSTEKTYAVTDILEVNKALSGINAGFIEKEKFDLKLDKYVSKIIVQNAAGTTMNTYENTKLAKVEIHRKNIVNSTVIIEYTMKISNEGELEGYVGDLIDYIPNDLTFSSEINKDWYKGTDGFLHNTTLADTIIEPGKSSSIVLTLTKVMTENNTGTTINTAEIGKTSNELSINDSDSTPNNRVEGEDDYGKAEVIISVGTGTEIVITIFVILGILLITGGSIFYIRKRKEGK